MIFFTALGGIATFLTFLSFYHLKKIDIELSLTEKRLDMLQDISIFIEKVINKCISYDLDTVHTEILKDMGKINFYTDRCSVLFRKEDVIEISDKILLPFLVIMSARTKNVGGGISCLKEYKAKVTLEKIKIKNCTLDIIYPLNFKTYIRRFKFLIYMKK
jgi:hypothetical protein